MKKIFLVPLFALFFISCSVDDEGLDLDAQQVLEKNAVLEVEGCETQSRSFGNTGELRVTNDKHNFFITIMASSGFNLSKVRLHIGNTLQDFPLVGQGNLPPGQMEHQEDFTSAIDSHTFVIPLNQYDKCFYIAANAVFSNDANSISLWAGDLEGPKGKWSYFQYCEQLCSPGCESVDAGKDNTIRISYSEAAAIESWDEVRKLYLSLLEPNVSRNGTFDPTIWDLIKKFNEQGEGEYNTMYTIGEGNCTDSVVLTIIVEEDQQIEPGCEEVSAGRDNSITITQSQAAAILSSDEVSKLYLSLLEEGVSRSGTFNPSIWDMIHDWLERRTGEFTLEYSITEGNCRDSVVLTVFVVPDPDNR